MFEIVLLLIILLVALTLYAVFGGADFGAGVWEFNTALRASEEERNLLYRAIGPVWETNHVWLIFILVLLFGAFPPAFASLNQALFVPMFVALIGIVFRGSAFAFRSQLKSGPDAARRTWIWNATFALASVLAPLFLGASVGAVASGQLPFDSSGKFTGNFLTGWLNPLSIFTGFFTVGLCAYCSATYMIREAHHDDSDNKMHLVLTWKRRAFVTGLVMGVLSAGGLVLVALRYDQLWQGMLQRGWPFILTSILSGIYSLWAIAGLRIGRAVFGASITSASVVIGWGFAQYPDLIPGIWSAEAAASPTVVLRVILISILVGAFFLIPSLYLLFRIFKMEPHA